MVSDNKKRHFKYINSKRRSKENIGLTLDADGHQKSYDKEKAEECNAFFASVLNSNDGLWAA